MFGRIALTLPRMTRQELVKGDPAIAMADLAALYRAHYLHAQLLPAIYDQAQEGEKSAKIRLVLHTLSASVERLRNQKAGLTSSHIN